MTERISKSKLKARLLEKFREVEASGEELIITDHGRPVLMIVPTKQQRTVADLFAGLQGQSAYQEDINQPTIEEWDEA